MEDIQSTIDSRGIPLTKAGVKNVKMPLVFEGQPTVARVTASASLSASERGTHMSRFLEVMETVRERMSFASLPALALQIRNELHAEDAYVAFDFPLFFRKAAPISGATGMMSVDLTVCATSKLDGEVIEIELSVPVASLCPCSKAISDYGAHNQRGVVTIRYRPKLSGDSFAIVGPEELIRRAESHASSALYPILKRPDERFVTMQAYDHPVFVEDLAREIALEMHNDERVSAFRVLVVNQESIHDHDAFAEYRWGM